MQPDTKLLVTDRGSIIMPNGSLAVPGSYVLAGDFVRHQEQLKILLAAGNLSEKAVPVTGIDVQRVDELPPALPNEINLKTGEGVPRSVAGSGSNDSETIRRVKEIAEAQAARQKALESVGADVSLTPEEAQALGLVQ